MPQNTIPATPSGSWMDMIRRYVAYAKGRWGSWSTKDAGSSGLHVLDRDAQLPLGLAMSPVAEFVRDDNLCKMDRETAASILRHAWDTNKTRTGDFWNAWKLLWARAALSLVSRPASDSPDTSKWKRGVPPFDDIWGWGLIPRRTLPSIDAETFQGHGVMALASAAAIQLDLDKVPPVSPTPSPAVDYSWLRQLMARLADQREHGVTPGADEPTTARTDGQAVPGVPDTLAPVDDQKKKGDGNGLAIIAGLYLAHKEGWF